MSVIVVSRVEISVRVWSVVLPMLLLVPAACKRRESRIAYVDLPAGAHIKEGDPVRFHSVDIGRVRKLSLQHSGVRATLLIERADAPVHRNDVVTVRPEGIFGEYAVEIMPASTDGPPLRDQDTLRAAAPDSLTPMQEALSRALMHEFTERMLHVDSTKTSKPSPPPPH